MGISRLRSEHRARFYTDDRELVTAVSAFLHDALQAGDRIMTLCTPAHRDALAEALQTSGHDPAALEGTERWLYINAHDVLTRLTRQQVLDRELFEDVLGSQVRTFLDGGTPVSVFGELVTLLWQMGEVNATVELETYWNELVAERPFALYCSYPLGSLQEPGLGRMIEQIEQLHSHVEDNKQPATMVKVEHRLPHSADAPRQARHMVIEALSEWGDDGLLDDAALIATELATNAIVHGGTGFDLTISREASTVRIAVRDGSETLPVLRDGKATASNGRGLRLISLLANRWGTDPSPGGKTVWAELHARGTRNR